MVGLFYPPPGGGGFYFIKTKSILREGFLRLEVFFPLFLTFIFCPFQKK